MGIRVSEPGKATRPKFRTAVNRFGANDWAAMWWICGTKVQTLLSMFSLNESLDKNSKSGGKNPQHAWISGSKIAEIVRGTGTKIRTLSDMAISLTGISDVVSSLYELVEKGLRCWKSSIKPFFSFNCFWDKNNLLPPFSYGNRRLFPPVKIPFSRAAWTEFIKPRNW